MFDRCITNTVDSIDIAVDIIVHMHLIDDSLTKFGGPKLGSKQNYFATPRS